MGIDGIGGGGGPPKVGGDGVAPGAAGSTQRTGADFSVGAPSKDVAATGDADLAALQRGELTRDEYLDRRVDNAVSHLQGALDAEHLQMLREQLREQLDADPVLHRLVQRATGSAEADDEG